MDQGRLFFLPNLYMAFNPVIDLRATTIAKAFLLNAIVLSAIAAISIELRGYLNVRKETKGLTELNKMMITMMGTFVIGFLIYLLARLTFGFGEGLLAAPPFSTRLI